MKNIHVLKTEKPSKLISSGKEFTLLNNLTVDKRCKHIYITSANEVKANVYALINGVLCKTETREGKIVSRQLSGGGTMDICKSEYLEIILTTDPDLIKDGVQAISDEFLEWFVKNPSCESVEIENKKVLVGWEPDYTYEDLGIDGSKNVYHNFYKIIIPQKEPKKETLKEDKMYSEQEVISILYEQLEALDYYGKEFQFDKFFEQFKKK